LPGSEQCAGCEQDLSQLDLPVAQDRVQRSLMEDPVSALRPHPPVTVPPETGIHAAMRTMLERNIGALLVVQGDRLVGMLSERDLMTKVAGVVSAAEERPVSDFMTPNPETVVETDTLAFALHKMDSGSYRHLPVLKGGKVIGIISVRDMLTHFTRLCNG
jgi:CBS domain-containing protein